jgi:hypothetical protein
MVKYGLEYLRKPAPLIRAIERGYRASDEELLEAVELVQPRMLPRRLHHELKRQLDPTTERRGRPRSGKVSEAELVHAIERVRHPEIPPEFLTHLAGRLRTGRRFTMADSNRAYHLRWRTRNRCQPNRRFDPLGEVKN